MFPTGEENPYDVFTEWYEEAIEKKIKDPNAFTLSTSTPDGMPSSRILLMKHYDENGIVFYTNINSRKGKELRDNPYAACCFYWRELGKQVRFNGVAERVTDAEADAYFAARRRGSQIGAWASMQSQSLDDRATLEKRVKEIEAQYDQQDVPRPPFWSGFRVKPLTIEFWQDGEFRLHQRLRYHFGDTLVKVEKLYP